MRSWWGWGDLERAISPDRAARVASRIAGALGVAPDVLTGPVPWRDVQIPDSKLVIPAWLSEIAISDPYERLSHCYGKSYVELIDGFYGRFRSVPDLVLYPKSPAEVSACLEWASDRSVTVVPYGGGSSVTGGINPAGAESTSGLVSLDTSKMNSLIEIDVVSQAAHLGAGVLGPQLERYVGEYGLTLRHYPQSFEYSSLGGWIVTRSAGHFATGRTRIDDFVESSSMTTPVGSFSSRRLPGDGAGPDRNGFVIGSEGTFGVMTSAWIRLQRRPEFKCSATVRFPQFRSAVDAVRDVVQSGLRPSNLRLLDETEAMVAASTNTPGSILMVGFESNWGPASSLLDAALSIILRADAALISRTDSDDPSDRDAVKSTASADPSAAWRSSFLEAPYVRDAMIGHGILMETFETAVVWAELPELIDQVMEGVREQLRRLSVPGWVSTRLTHAYPDGAAPYFTVIAKVSKGSEISQWRSIKDVASRVIVESGGTITHHHAVGRDHASGFESQTDPLFLAGLKALKEHFDPSGMMNPGVLMTRASQQP